MPINDEESLRDRMLEESIDQLRMLLASELRIPVARRAAISAMRTLVLERPFRPNGMRFEVLLTFLFEDGRLSVEYATTLLAVIGEGSEWLYEGIMVAAHADGLTGDAWLREHYPKLPFDLQVAARVVLDQVNPALGRALAVL